MNLKRIFISIYILILFSILLSCGHGKIVENRKVVWKNVFAGKIVSHTFKITNTYGKTMKIGYIRPQCPACTTFELSKKNLEPGDTTKLTIHFDSAGYKGTIKYNILVYHNLDPNGKPIEFITIAEVKNYIKTSKRLFLNFGRIESSKKHDTVLKLKLTPKVADDKLDIAKIDTNKFNIFKYKIKSVKPNSKLILISLGVDSIMKNLNVNIEKLKEVYRGELKGKYKNLPRFFIIQLNNVTKFVIPVKINTGLSKHPYLRFVAAGHIKGDINTNLKNNTVGFENILKFIGKKLDFSKTKSFLISSDKNKPFNVVNLSTDNEVITLEKTKVNSSTYKIIVHFNKDKNSINSLKRNRGNIFIETDNPFAKFFRVKLELN